MDTNDGWRISNHQPVTSKQTNRVPIETFTDYLMSQEEHVSQYYTEIDFLTAPITTYGLVKSTN